MCEWEFRKREAASRKQRFRLGGPGKNSKMTDRVEETQRKSGAIAWEVRKKNANGKSEEGKRQADFAWEVLQKSENERF